ncbi:unnamed protein product [Clonostachys chloroleuca]|uniref:Uncharacterized protein n=1 Tax=Clonostachys chloroleuca TaxID=1926264 RepID=A0AA35M7K9_9HYPO|nr:unnamed protein product [Clonostachys chloroleuca]
MPNTTVAPPSPPPSQAAISSKDSAANNEVVVAALGAKYAEAGCCHKDKIDECEIRCADTNPADGARVGLT